MCFVITMTYPSSLRLDLNGGLHLYLDLIRHCTQFLSFTQVGVLFLLNPEVKTTQYDHVE